MKILMRQNARIMKQRMEDDVKYLK